MVFGAKVLPATVAAFVSETGLVAVPVAARGLLKGGLLFSPVTMPVTGSSVKMAYPARRTVFWFLKGLHTMPTLGWTFLLFVWNGWSIPFVPTCTRETVAGSKMVKRLAASVGVEYQV